MERGRGGRTKSRPTIRAVPAENVAQDVGLEDGEQTLASQLENRDKGKDHAKAHTQTHKEGTTAPQRPEQTKERNPCTNENRKDRTQGLPLQPTRPRDPGR